MICGIVQDERYFADAVEPHLDGDQVLYLWARSARSAGRMSSAVRRRCSTRSISIQPFGLSVVEAMACGTPVVAYQRGSMAER